MKILVTGGAGFIGSNVVDAYIKEGHEVVVVDNLYSGKRENLHPDAKFYLLDVRAPEVRKVLEYERPDIINHHAAQISVPESVANPLFDASVNIEGFLNLLEGARAVGVQKTIFISSGGAIYGEAAVYPTPEDYPPQPLSPYAIAKAVCEDYLAFYHHQYGLDFTVLRYANVYGPRQIPHGEAGVVAIFMDRLLENKPCTVYHFAEEPQGMIRDYCFVGDIVEANLAALRAGSGRAYNIGTGRETRTRALFEAIFDAVALRRTTDPGLRTPKTGPARHGDLRRSCLRVERAQTELGWTAKTDLKGGLAQTLEWRLSK